MKLYAIFFLSTLFLNSSAMEPSNIQAKPSKPAHSDIQIIYQNNTITTFYNKKTYETTTINRITGAKLILQPQFQSLPPERVRMFRDQQ